MWIKNARIFCEDGRFRLGSLRMETGRVQTLRLASEGWYFEELGEEQAPEEDAPSPASFEGEQQEGEDCLDACGGLLIPGLIDLHFHGCLGEDVCDGKLEGMRRIARYEAENGITAICPATLTLPEEELCQVLHTMSEWRRMQEPEEAELVGINMEGPFISKAKKGAQNGAYIRRCDVGTARRFLEASGGLVKLIGIAPEVNPGFEDYIREISSELRVSLAHSNADYETAGRAFRAGAVHAVHLYNAMTGLSHRAPGAVGAVFENPAVTAELITDGVHIHPMMVRLAFRQLGQERAILISDSLRSAGMPDGRYLLGGQEIEKRGKLCTLVPDGNIAGSVSNLMDCFRTAVLEMEIPFADALLAASRNPARRLGIEDAHGTICEEKLANLVLLDQTLRIRRVFREGREVRGENSKNV